MNDATLADGFTRTKHTHPTTALDPTVNKLPNSLNVLVIGASRGIGAGVAHAYAQAGVANLILAARASSAQELAAVERKAKELGPETSIKSLAVDITSAESVSELARCVKEEVKKLDVVIFNSGYSGPVVLKVGEGSPQDFQDVFDVNVQGAYLAAHYFVPLLIESNGAKTFIAVGSIAACLIDGHIANTSYCISKFAQARLVEFLAQQYGADGVLAIAVHPGAVHTEMAERNTPESFRPCKLLVIERLERQFLTKLDLTDDVGLCGAFCVWLSHEKQLWLNGRLVSATWDVEELIEKRYQIEQQDLLKFGYRVGNASAAGERQ